jgi:antitoxin HigA-1
MTSKSLITTDRAPVHPGEILKEDFMVPMGISANQLGKALHVPTGRLTQIINGQRAVTADTALRLAQYFGTSPELWLNLQSYYELEVARDQNAAQIAADIVPRKRSEAAHQSKPEKKSSRRQHE